MKMEKLFVYGTLAPGRPNAHWLANLPGSWQKASVKGILHPEGWGATLGYPALVLDPEGEEVQGFLFTSDQLSTYWDTLDEFEGEGYERLLAPVSLEDQSIEEAFVYALKQS